MRTTSWFLFGLATVTAAAHSHTLNTNSDIQRSAIEICQEALFPADRDLDFQEIRYSVGRAVSRKLRMVAAAIRGPAPVTPRYDYRAWSLGLPSRLSPENISNRGFAQPFFSTRDPIYEAKAVAVGYASWYVRMFPVSNVEQAKEIERNTEISVDGTTRLIHFRNLYVLMPGVTISEDLKGEDQTRLLKQAMRAPVFEFAHADDPEDLKDFDSKKILTNETLTPVYIPNRVIMKRLDPRKAMILRHFEKEPVGIRWSGWTYGRVSGLMLLKNIVNKTENGKFYPDVKRDRDNKIIFSKVDPNDTSKKPKMEPEYPTTRWRVEWNHAMEDVLKGAAAEPRNGQTAVSNRIDETTIEEFMTMFERGVAWSGEVIEETQDPETGEIHRKLVGGAFGNRYGKYLEVNSVFGDMRAKKAIVEALKDRWTEAVGPDGFIISTTVTTFSEQMGAKYYSGEELVQILDNAPELRKPMDMTTPWAPKVALEIRSRLFGSSKLPRPPDDRFPVAGYEFLPREKPVKTSKAPPSAPIVRSLDTEPARP